MRVETLPLGLTWGYQRGRENPFVEAILNANLDNKTGALSAVNYRYNNDTPAWNKDDVRAIADIAETSPGLMDVRAIDAQDYFGELAKYRFLIAPNGNGIQSPKFFEAALVMTISITRRYKCFEDLQAYGMPIVVVDKWSDITHERLEKWWTRLKPRLEQARWTATKLGTDSLLFGKCYSSV